MWFSDLGGGRAHQHKSTMCALPNIVIYILLLWFPLPATASSTRTSRSCHLAVVGDRPALPAKSPSLPVVLVGAAPEWTRLNTSEQLGTRPRERPVMKTTLGPALACHHARAPSFWDAAPRQEQTDARLSTRWVMAAPMRQRAPSPEVHSHRWITLKSARVMRAAWATSGTAHGELRLAGAVSGWSDASQLPLRAEDRSSSDMRDDARMLPSLYCDSSSSTDRHGCDAITSKLNFVDKFGLLAKRLIPRQDTCSFAASLPTSRTTSRLLTSRQAAASPPGWRALAPHQWRARRLLTRLRGDTAVAPVLGASAQSVPAPAGFLVLKTLTEATAPARSFPLPQAEDTGPSGAQVASAHCAGRPVLV